MGEGGLGQDMSVLRNKKNDYTIDLKTLSEA